MIGKFKMAALIGAAVAFVGHWVLHFAVAGALFAAIGLSGGGHSPAEAGPDCSNDQTNQTIYAKALDDHGCDADEWHFIINQIDRQEQAPADILVTFANGNTVIVPLEKRTGKVAHYTTDSNLSSTVMQATATIYSGWPGNFNLSHGPCSQPTPTPTPTATPEPTPTVTPEPTPVATPEPTSTPVGTSISQGPAGFPDTGSGPDDGGGKDFGTGARIVLSVIGVILASTGAGILLYRLRSR